MLGPMTRAMLLVNTVLAAKHRRRRNADEKYRGDSQIARTIL